MGIGDWGLGIGDWGLGPIPNPQFSIHNSQSPIPNPQSPIPLTMTKLIKIIIIKYFEKFIYQNIKCDLHFFKNHFIYI